MTATATEDQTSKPRIKQHPMTAVLARQRARMRKRAAERRVALDRAARQEIEAERLANL
jgi:hypothetical protein